MNVNKNTIFPLNFPGRKHNRNNQNIDFSKFKKPFLQIPSSKTSASTSSDKSKKDLSNNDGKSPSSGRQTSSKSSTPGTSSSDTSSSDNSCVIVAITEGRGNAREEVGMAAIDIHKPEIKLYQVSDTYGFINTLTNINVLCPTEILMPASFLEFGKSNRLIEMIKNYFKKIPVTPVQRRFFDANVGLQQLHYLCADSYKLMFLDLQYKYYALSAAHALLKYLEINKYIFFAQKSLKITYHHADHTTAIDVDAAYLLELVACTKDYNRDGSLYGVLNYCKTKCGRRQLRSNLLQPYRYETDINSRLDSVVELANSPELLCTIQSILPKLLNVDGVLRLCIKNPDCFNQYAANGQMNYTIMLKSTLIYVEPLAVALKSAQSDILKSMVKILSRPECKLIIDKVSEVIQDDVKSTSPKWTPFLRCFAIKSGINVLLDIARKIYSEILNDAQDYITLMAKNHNLPLFLNHTGVQGYHIQMRLGPKQRKIKPSEFPKIFLNVVRHQNSITMTTVTLVEFNRRLKDITLQIDDISYLIICELLNKVRDDVASLYSLCECVAELDVIQCLAQASIGRNYVRPIFGNYLEVKQSRHPMLEYLREKDPTPNDIFATEDKNFHLITGPNNSGKTIFIRQIVLLQIMAQIGSLVPAESARFRICDHIFARIGFNDSIEQNASTLQLDLREMKSIMGRLTPKSLIIADEFCRGTTAGEGTAIAWAVCEELLDSGAFVFFTTHFLTLSKLQELYYNVTNWHMETSENNERLIYTHRILHGTTCIEHYGLKAARSTAMPPSVVERATALVETLTPTVKPMPQNDNDDSADRYVYDFVSNMKLLKKKEQLTKEKLEELITELRENVHLVPPEIDQTYENVDDKSVSSPGNVSQDDVQINKSFERPNENEFTGEPTNVNEDDEDNIHGVEPLNLLDDSVCENEIDIYPKQLSSHEGLGENLFAQGPMNRNYNQEDSFNFDEPLNLSVYDATEKNNDIDPEQSILKNTPKFLDYRKKTLESTIETSFDSPDYDNKTSEDTAPKNNLFLNILENAPSQTSDKALQNNFIDDVRNKTKTSTSSENINLNLLNTSLTTHASNDSNHMNETRKMNSSSSSTSNNFQNNFTDDERNKTKTSTSSENINLNLLNTSLTTHYPSDSNHMNETRKMNSSSSSTSNNFQNNFTDDERNKTKTSTSSENINLNLLNTSLITHASNDASNSNHINETRKMKSWSSSSPNNFAKHCFGPENTSNVSTSRSINNNTSFMNSGIRNSKGTLNELVFHSTNNSEVDLSKTQTNLLPQIYLANEQCVFGDQSNINFRNYIVQQKTSENSPMDFDEAKQLERRQYIIQSPKIKKAINPYNTNINVQNTTSSSTNESLKQFKPKSTKNIIIETSDCDTKTEKSYVSSNVHKDQETNKNSIFNFQKQKSTKPREQSFLASVKAVRSKRDYREKRLGSEDRSFEMSLSSISKSFQPIFGQSSQHVIKKKKITESITHFNVRSSKGVKQKSFIEIVEEATNETHLFLSSTGNNQSPSKLRREIVSKLEVSCGESKSSEEREKNVQQLVNRFGSGASKTSSRSGIFSDENSSRFKKYLKTIKTDCNQEEYPKLKIIPLLNTDYKK